MPGFDFVPLFWGPGALFGAGRGLEALAVTKSVGWRLQNRLATEKMDQKWAKNEVFGKFENFEKKSVGFLGDFEQLFFRIFFLPLLNPKAYF